jgi:hypothetical protein
MFISLLQKSTRLTALQDRAALIVTRFGNDLCRRRDEPTLSMLNPIGKLNPGMFRFFEDRHRGRWKCRVRECANSDDAPAWPEISIPIQRRSARRAEVEANLAPFLSIPFKNLAIPFDRDLRLFENRPTARQRSSPSLAIAAVA